MSFLSVLNDLNWDEVGLTIASKTAKDVENSLNKNVLSHDDFLALISPAAESFLKQMADKSYQITRQRFGNTVQLFIPLYLSNKCTNICTYCGFSIQNKIKRKTLSLSEIEAEIQSIKNMGFDHILLVTGEAIGTVGMNFFRQVLPLIRPHFSHISMEVQPLNQSDYEELMSLGLDAVLVYQETYHRPIYQQYHLRGSKSNFDYRLETPDRLGRSHMNKIGLGSLIGLANWRIDTAMLAYHLDYLEKKYWRSRFSISFPRLRPCEGEIQPVSIISDRQLIQLICAYRLFKPQVELSLSTRESATFRDNVLPLGVTTMSAFSSTQPGGYVNNEFLQHTHLEQFAIDDIRHPKEVAQAIKEKGLEVVWKDWDATFTG